MQSLMRRPAAQHVCAICLTCPPTIDDLKQLDFSSPLSMCVSRVDVDLAALHAQGDKGDSDSEKSLASIPAPHGIEQGHADEHLCAHHAQAKRHSVHPLSASRPSYETEPGKESKDSGYSSATHAKGSAVRPDPHANIDKPHAAHVVSRHPTTSPCCRAELEEFFGISGNGQAQRTDLFCHDLESDGKCQQGWSPGLYSHDAVFARIIARMDAADTREAAQRSPALREVLVRLQERNWSMLQ